MSLQVFHVAIGRVGQPSLLPPRAQALRAAAPPPCGKADEGADTQMLQGVPVAIYRDCRTLHYIYRVFPSLSLWWY